MVVLNLKYLEMVRVIMAIRRVLLLLLVLLVIVLLQTSVPTWKEVAGVPPQFSGCSRVLELGGRPLGLAKLSIVGRK